MPVPLKMRQSHGCGLQRMCGMVLLQALQQLCGAGRDVCGAACEDGAHSAFIAKVASTGDHSSPGVPYADLKCPLQQLHAQAVLLKLICMAGIDFVRFRPESEVQVCNHHGNLHQEPRVVCAYLGSWSRSQSRTWRRAQQQKLPCP